jgi:hypothetical protein
MIPSRFIFALGLLAMLLASCQPAPSSTDPNIALTTAVETAFAQINVPSETPAWTETPVPTATVPRTPPALPPMFQTSLLKPHHIPRNYMTNACQQLKNKWDPNKSAPGRW